jgi:hypothetical protein
MARYFVVMSGLRGCYMPDASYCYAVTTRRELRSIIEDEAQNQSCDGMFVGLSKRAVSWAAAHAWREYKERRGAILPFGRRGEGKPYSIEIAPISRREFVEYQQSEGN